MGGVLWLAANVRSVTDANGRAALVYSGRDVTSRVEAELALERRPARPAPGWACCSTSAWRRRRPAAGATARVEVLDLAL